MKNEYKITREEHHWTSEEKIKWMGYGEWVEEADTVVFEYLGYDALVYRILKREPYTKEEAYFGGHLCGYVRIPENHIYFKNREIPVDCHGGLTFSKQLSTQSQKLYGTHNVPTFRGFTSPVNKLKS